MRIPIYRANLFYLVTRSDFQSSVTLVDQVTTILNRFVPVDRAIMPQTALHPPTQPGLFFPPTL